MKKQILKEMTIKWKIFGIAMLSIITFYVTYMVHNFRLPFEKKPIILKVAISPDFPPFAIIEDDKISGIDIDIINEISKRSKIKFEIDSMSFASVIASTTIGKTDLCMSGITPNDERRKSLDFSDNYYKSNISIISQKNKIIKKITELEKKSVAVQSGTVVAEYLQEINEKTKKKLKISNIDDNYIAIQMLLHSKIDAIIMETMQANAFCREYSEISCNEIEKSPIFSYAIGFNQNLKYQKEINNFLSQMKKDGTLQKIIEKWQLKASEKKLVKISKFNKEYIKSLLWIIGGIIITIQYSLFSIFIGITIAILLNIARFSKFKALKIISKSYISMIRGTPLLLQLSLIYFIIPSITKIDISVFIAGVAALSLNSAAYMAEIIRGGLKGIDNGQFEACKSLNLSKYQTYKNIIFPQVIRNIIPALINEFISLIKESSVISVLGGEEIMKRANIVISSKYDYITPLLIAGLSYYILSYTLEKIGNFIENKAKY